MPTLWPVGNNRSLAARVAETETHARPRRPFCACLLLLDSTVELRRSRSNGTLTYAARSRTPRLIVYAHLTAALSTELRGPKLNLASPRRPRGRAPHSLPLVGSEHPTLSTTSEARSAGASRFLADGARRVRERLSRLRHQQYGRTPPRRRRAGTRHQRLPLPRRPTERALALSRRHASMERDLLGMIEATRAAAHRSHLIS